tara:strand:+ start:21016 stop:21765 length:750 start_codon:yes stop_codon:yes gene_type:complete
MFSVRIKKYILYVGGVIAALVLLLGALSQAGFVVSGAYIVKGGTLTITSAYPDSIVFIDNRQVGRVAADGTFSKYPVKPGKRSIILSHTTSWPWMYTVNMQSRKNISIAPLQITKDPIRSLLTASDDPLLLSANSALSDYREPTRPQPLERNRRLVWVEGTTIYTQENDTVRSVISIQSPITSVFWYGDREDAIIVSARNAVFALDLRYGGAQNYLPLYTGTKPQAVADPIRSNIIYVKDAGDIFTLDI